MTAAGLLAAALTAVFAACSRSQPDAKSASAKTSGIHAAPPADSGSWLRFRTPPPAGPGSGAAGGVWTAHGGPDWSFDAPGLPALSVDGARAVVPVRETSLSGVPNLAVGVVGITQDTLEAAHPVLAAAEFLAATAAADAGGAFAGLADTVRSRLAGIDSLRKRENWTAMRPCALPDGDAAQPPCSEATQRIECGNVSLAYAQGALTATAAGAARTYARPQWIHAPAQDATVGEVPVKECFASAWFDKESGVFLGEMMYLCQRGGDGCIEQPRWHAVRLVAAGENAAGAKRP